MNKGNEPEAPVTDDDTSDTSDESELGAIAEEAGDVRNDWPSVIEEQATKKKKKKRKFFRLPFKRKTKKVPDSEGHIEAESKEKTRERRKSSRYTYL